MILLKVRLSLIAPKKAWSGRVDRNTNGIVIYPVSY